MNEQLPDGWAEVELGQVCTFNYGKSLPEKIRVPGNYPVYGSNGIVGTHESFLIEGPTIIIGRKGSAGAVHFNTESCFPIDTTYYVEQTAGVDLKFLYYFLKIADLTSLETSSAVPGLNRNSAYVLNFPLPPLAEQARIVTALDGLLGRVHSAQEQLATVPKLLKRFRQGVLSAAVSGKLTEDWREENPDVESAEELLKNIYSFKEIWAQEEGKNNSEARRLQAKLEMGFAETPDYYILPKTWIWSSLSDACHLIVDCHNKTAPYEEHGIYLVRTSNIRDGKIDLSDIRYISETTYNHWSRRLSPKSGDILFTREAPMGEAAIIPEGMRVCLGQRTMLLRMPQNLLENEYVLYSLIEPNIDKQIENKALGATVKHLRVGDVERLVIPLPPLAEQQEIVRRVSGLLNWADKLEAGYKAAKRQLDAMPAAILAKAFAGELTEQNPADEPATVLLERIRAERLAEQQRPTPKKIPTIEKVPKRRKTMAEQFRSIKEILTATNAPVSAHTVWQQSVHKDDIEAFYADLKQLVDVDGSVLDVKEGEQSYLKLADAD